MRTCWGTSAPFGVAFGAEHAAERDALALLVARMRDLPPDEAAFITFRLLLTAPWPAATARHCAQPRLLAAAALGTIFEFGRVGHLRHLCTCWVKWADKQLTAVAPRRRRGGPPMIYFLSPLARNAGARPSFPFSSPSPTSSFPRARGPRSPLRPLPARLLCPPPPPEVAEG